jgi:inosine/xanthosine triphosphate pyrophosphatase family protein
MLNILFATTNPGKVLRYRRLFQNDKIKFYSCQDIGILPPQVAEDADTETENSVEKAKRYYEALSESEVELPKGKWVCLGVDTGLYFENVSRLEQPGPHVQNIAGAGVFGENEEEKFQKMATYYSALAKKYGGSVKGYFKDVFTFYDGHNTIQESSLRPIELVDTMYFKDINFPVASFIKYKRKYIHEFSNDEYKEYMKPSHESINILLDKVKKLR